MSDKVDVEFQEATKLFGSFVAVDHVSFQIRSGEFFSMLGPSGSGKTTCLRLVAGFSDVTSGRVLLNGANVQGVPPYKRNVNTVFQDYALFPHMTISENIGYGLKIQKVSKPEIQKRVGEMLEMVRLPHVGDRKPTELSGGQKQRIALARALINKPQVLLLDEPLGALDLKLREEMQVELKTLQKQIGITFIFVTHDQEEALSMSDRIAVFNKGKIEQLGTPREIYEKPQSEFVAGFVGVSNLIRGSIAVETMGRDSVFLVRPEKIQIASSASDSQPKLEAVLKTKVYSGATSRMIFETKTKEQITVLDRQTIQDLQVGSTYRLTWERDKAHEILSKK